MAEHNKLGKDGELTAFMLLQRDGYNVVHTNWKYQKAEVDIIAKKGSFLIFVEVKTRGSKKFGKPSDSINKKKISLYKTHDFERQALDRELHKPSKIHHHPSRHTCYKIVSS